MPQVEQGDRQQLRDLVPGELLGRTKRDARHRIVELADRIAVHGQFRIQLATAIEEQRQVPPASSPTPPLTPFCCNECWLQDVASLHLAH